LSLTAALAVAEPMVIRRGTAAPPPTLDPNKGAGTLASPIITDMFVALLARDAESRPAAASAESWSVSDDGTTYIFKLRPDLRWSDGRPLTAADFEYSYRRLMDPATGSRLVGVLYPIKNAKAVVQGKMPIEALGVRALDARTLEVQLEHRTPYLIELFGNLQAVPVPRHVIERHGNDWTRVGTMVSNGPYVLAERLPQSYIKLEKNPFFYDADQVSIDEVYWAPTQDLGTSMRRFRAGELDVMLNFPPDQIEWIKANIPETLHIVPSQASYFLVFNTQRPPYDDIRVRKALSLAVDREAITGKLLRTGVRPAYSFVPPDYDGYPGIRVPEQDLPLADRQAQARELLADAGFDSSNPLKVTLSYDTQEENRKTMVAIAAMWQAIGVRTELLDVEFRNLNRMVRTRDYEVARWAFFSSFDDAYAMLQALAGDNPNNWPGLVIPEYDALLQQSNYATDAMERQRLMADAEQILMTQYPVLPVYFYIGRRLVQTHVKGWFDTPRGPTPSRYLSIDGRP
jgi:oligopeptide transport system substrate-binding protein